MFHEIRILYLQSEIKIFDELNFKVFTSIENVSFIFQYHIVELDCRSSLLHPTAFSNYTYPTFFQGLNFLVKKINVDFHSTNLSMTPKFFFGQSCWPTIFEKLFRRCYKKNRHKNKN